MKPAQARFRCGTGCLAVLILAAMPLPAAPAGRAAPPGAKRIAAGEAAQHVGDRKQVCVTGKIQLYRAKPEIVVKDPAQLVLDKLIQDPQ